MKQQSKRPTRKLLAGGISGLTIGPALTTILVYILEASTGQPLPNAVQTAIGTLLTTGAVVLVGYLTPPSPEDAPVPR